MPNQFQLNIPTGDGSPTNFTLEIGKILYVLGANGTGKSSLVTRLFSANQQYAKRISAHRQTWFESNSLDMTPRNRLDVGNSFQSQDGQVQARYREWNPSARSSMAIFDLIDADTMQERKIAAFVRAGNDASAKKEAQDPSPIQIINELMRLSNLPIEVSLEERQKIVARKNGGQGYSVAELSDGERNAFLIAAEVLTANAGTLILIDEPERHLHRSIISPLLKLLFARRKDCAFIISTHESMLPVDTAEASTWLVRGCEYQGADVKAWTVDMVPSGTAINEDLKRDLLGARRKILFVEGAVQSLDTPLYSLLFPQVSVIAKEGCREVEYAVRGLRGAPDMHWIEAWGIVDNDQRSPDNVGRLREAGIWALSHYSVESLYYHPAIVARVAQRQAQMIGANAITLMKLALNGAVDAARGQKAHLVTSAVLRLARDRMLNSLPTRESVEGTNSVIVEVDISTLRVAEESRFDSFVNAADWDGLLTRYPLRESSAFRRVVSELKMPDRGTYQAAVLKLLQDEPAALTDLRNLLGDLYPSVMH
jgi:ABC-type cobalamin/Fe3+-siderophores transport system ATPase subunit